MRFMVPFAAARARTDGRDRGLRDRDSDGEAQLLPAPLCTHDLVAALRDEAILCDEQDAMQLFNSSGPDGK